MWIVSERDSGSGQEVMLTQELFIIESLKGLVIDSADGVAVRKHRMAVAIHVCTKHGGVADATLS